jgi:DNA-binding NarL/FixJ family response regulator
VGEAGDGRTALELIRLASPTVALLDIGMPGLSGIDVARAIEAEGHAVGVILLTIEDEPEFVDQALALGVRGYVLKSSVETDLVSAIRAVAAGSHYVSPAVTSHLVRRRVAGNHGLESLTRTERRVLRLIGELKTSKEIAEDLGISARTVEKHRANVSAKLDVHGSLALAKFALNHLSEL